MVNIGISNSHKMKAFILVTINVSVSIRLAILVWYVVGTIEKCPFPGENLVWTSAGRDSIMQPHSIGEETPRQHTDEWHA